jgi:hypothetical protein
MSSQQATVKKISRKKVKSIILTIYGFIIAIKCPTSPNLHYLLVKSFISVENIG